VPLVSLEKWCVPVPVVLLRLVVLGRVLGFCAVVLICRRHNNIRLSTYWPLRRLCVSNRPGGVRGDWIDAEREFGRVCGSLTSGNSANRSWLGVQLRCSRTCPRLTTAVSSFGAMRLYHLLCYRVMLKKRIKRVFQ
jgi:hypothetical protein